VIKTSRVTVRREEPASEEHLAVAENRREKEERRATCSRVTLVRKTDKGGQRRGSEEAERDTEGILTTAE
jgi:hypothetical protein